MSPLIVFSHLRWDFVYQRPQQLLSRLALERPVLYIEEPIGGAATAHIETVSPCAGVEVLRFHVTSNGAGFHDDHLASVQTMLNRYLEERDIASYLVWFYTPMAYPYSSELTPSGVIYDCMDELSAFRFAPRQLLQRENALFQSADLVFTGGPSLFESKKHRHDAVYCFPSSVDAAHYGAYRGSADVHPAQAGLQGPLLGYFGVIDERLDIALIEAMAQAKPDWNIVMVGPVVKIDESSLPRLPNIHWLGQRPYEDLPRLIAGWDVCLLPFALNDATKFISPTKTLEYLAAGKPAVSTPIKDVVEPYSDVVSIAATPAEFIAACEEILGRTDEQGEAWSMLAERAVAATSWDETVGEMSALLDRIDSGARASVDTGLAAQDDTSETKSYGTVILGAGPTGLSAGLTLRQGSVILEKEATVGGWCRSVEDNGFTFDYAGHIMFSNDSFVLDLYKRLLGDNMHWQNREAWIYSKSVYTRYPFQGALYGLPPKVLKECIVGAIEARFGPLKTPSAANGDKAKTAVVPLPTTAPQNFEEFIYRVWGAGVAKHFAIPYNKKLWAVPLSEMETSWLGGRVPLPDLEEMIEGALEPVAKPMGPNARFGYPLRGGFQAMMNGFLPLLECDLELNAKVVRVSPSRRTVALADGRTYRYDTLISTMPLPKLVASMGDEAPQRIRQAAESLRHVSVRCVNIGVARENITGKHWIYYPEDTIFHRIFVQGNASPHCNAEGGFGITCEITYSEYKPLPIDGDELIQRCIQDCIKVGMLRDDDKILAANQVDMPYAYVVYDHGRAAAVDLIRKWAEQSGILLAGRYSEWEYYNSDHAFLAGKKIADRARALAVDADSSSDSAGAIPATA